MLAGGAEESGSIWELRRYSHFCVAGTNTSAKWLYE